MLEAQIYTITLGSGVTQRLLYKGTMFKIISATGAVNVRTDSARLTGLVSGQGMEENPFNWLEVTDASAATNTIKLLISTDGFLDGLTGAMQITQTVPVRSASFANTAKTVTSTSAQLIAANSTRTYLLIQNKDTSGTIYLNWGASAATTANGVKIGPGGAYELSDVQSTQAMQAIGDIASNSNVLVVEG